MHIRARWAGALLVGIVLVTACHNNPDNVKAAEKANDQKTDSLTNKQSVTDSSTAVASKQDAEFMVKATAGNQLEVLLGNMAQTNAASPAVKHFGQMMIRDHTAGVQELRGLAVRKRIILPDTVSNQQKKEENDLQKKKGHDFDKAYVKLMEQDHKDDIDEFQKEAQNANDSDIRAEAIKMLPILKMHLDSLQPLLKGAK